MCLQVEDYKYALEFVAKEKRAIHNKDNQEGLQRKLSQLEVRVVMGTRVEALQLLTSLRSTCRHTQPRYSKSLMLPTCKSRR